MIVVLAIGGFVFVNSTKPVNNNPAFQEDTEKEELENQAKETNTTSDATDSATNSESVKEFTVSGSNFKFEPSTLQVNKGDTVKITFKNSGGFHDFVIDALNIKTKTIPDGQSESVQFIADKVGTFEYYCSVGNHKQMGMKGTLTVQ